MRRGDRSRAVRARLRGLRRRSPQRSLPPRPSPLAQATHEYPSPAPKPQTGAGGLPRPVQAIRRFTTAYINWNAQTVAADMRSLAAQSVGQARSAMQLAAAGTIGDYELQRGGVANSGTVEAVAPLAGRRDQYVVVTLESTTATNTTAYEGLAPGLARGPRHGGRASPAASGC